MRHNLPALKRAGPGSIDRIEKIHFLEKAPFKQLSTYFQCKFLEKN